jgi:hypothetical protein
MIELLQFGDKSLAVTRNGIFEIDWAVQEALDEAKSTNTIFGDVSSWFNRVKPQTFKDLTPKEYVFGDSVRVAMSPEQSQLYIYNSDRVDCLELDATTGKFVVKHTLPLSNEEPRSALIAVGAEHCIIAREDEPLLLMPRDLSSIIAQVAMPEDDDARQIVVAGKSDQFSIVTHGGMWFTLRGNEKSLRRMSCPWQSSISGITWISEDQVWVGIQPNRAALFEVSSGKVLRALNPTPSRLEFFYHWIARPLYLVSPKPNSLNGVLQKLLSRDKAGQTQLINNDLSAARVEVEIWQPILSNLAFVTALLAIGCIYVWRKEF